jgi:RNA polymerase sigma factor (sigma-70 family)
MRGVLRHIRRAAFLQARDGPTDDQLLESFLTLRDETAFEALLRRHGPMVLGVCYRVLRHTQDAEDAFQATFLVLARRAASLQSRDLLGNWLYGVAHRTALKARAMNVKRRAKEGRAREMVQQAASLDDSSDELLSELDTALSRLPDKYRAAIVLCELEGRSRKDVAQLLGLPMGTLSSRLAQAKKLLAKRLSQFGAGSLTASLSQGTASARVPPALLHATAKAALQVLAGQALKVGLISTQVITLAEGVMKAMLLNKLKVLGVVVLAMCVSTVAGLGYRAVAQEPGQGRSAPRAARLVADELEELRLEIAALRKGLQTTRDRVQALENEVQTLRAREAAPPGGSGTGSTGGGGPGAMMPGGSGSARKTMPPGATKGMLLENLPPAQVDLVPGVKDRGATREMLPENLPPDQVDLVPGVKDRQGQPGGKGAFISLFDEPLEQLLIGEAVAAERRHGMAQVIQGLSQAVGCHRLVLWLPLL